MQVKFVGRRYRLLHFDSQGQKITLAKQFIFYTAQVLPSFAVVTVHMMQPNYLLVKKSVLLKRGYIITNKFYSWNNYSRLQMMSLTNQIMTKISK